MGNNIQIILPYQVRFMDVATAIAIIGGAKKEQNDIGEGSMSTSADFEVKPSSIPELADIYFTDIHGNSRWCQYHFEFENGKRGLMPRATPFWIAVGRKLVKFFGGELVYNDCGDNEGPDEEYSSESWITADDGEEWDTLQSFLFDLEPITREEINDAKKVASYPERNRPK